MEGVQRIRGLAGSGKTIVLALKAAYLHTRYPDWRIAVTFNTRSLKAQFRRLITRFCIERSGEEPDWTKIRIINAWGHPAERREMAFTMNIAVRRERRFSTLGTPLLHSEAMKRPSMVHVAMHYNMLLMPQISTMSFF